MRLSILSLCLQAEVTQRLSNKVAPGRAAVLQSHEDLARKLQVLQINKLSQNFLTITET